MGLPKPSGPFVVGCADVMTKVVQMPTDITCPSSVLEKGVDFGTFVRIYYPTEDDSQKHYKEAKILPDEQTSLYATSMFSIFKLKWLSGLASFVLRGALQHSFIDAPLIPQTKYEETLGHKDEENKKFPLVIFSHGLIGFRHIYSTFCSDLASHGFVVASVEHRDGSALPTYFMDPETNKPTPLPYMDHPTAENADSEIIKMRNKQVDRRAEEVSKLLDLLNVVNTESQNIENLFPSKFDLNSLKNRLEVDEPLIIGHSFGGATTLNSVNKDDRFKCSIVLDPWFLPLSEDEFYESGFKKPTFTIFTELFNWNKNIQRCQRFLDGLPKGYGEVITLRNAVHWDQCDGPGFMPWFLSAIGKFTGGIPKNHDFEKGIVLQRQIILDYLRKYLKQKTYPMPLLTDDYKLPDNFFMGMRVFSHKDKTEEEVEDVETSPSNEKEQMETSSSTENKGDESKKVEL